DLARRRRLADAGVGDHHVERAARLRLGPADGGDQLLAVLHVERDRDDAGRFVLELAQLFLSPGGGEHRPALFGVVQRETAAQPARRTGDEDAWHGAPLSTVLDRPPMIDHMTLRVRDY